MTYWGSIYFSYGVLHRFIDGTVDADRLDYINRDMLSSGYISGAIDLTRITKQAILIDTDGDFELSFYDDALIDIEHMLEMRFNLYKKIIYNHKIAKSDTLLENVILFLSEAYFLKEEDDIILNSISMLWRFLELEDHQIQLDYISQLDENWLISLFKKEYFHIKSKPEKIINDHKYLISFDEVLFGKKHFHSYWKNLNDFYNFFDYSQIERYQLRETLGNSSKKQVLKLQEALDAFIEKWQKTDNELFIAYQIVSVSTGVSKSFKLYDGEKLLSIDQVSTLRKRLKKSQRNTVPFLYYSNKQDLLPQMHEELKNIVLSIWK